MACAIELALDKPTTKYVDFAMSRVRMLLDFGIVPYVVFDGDALPSKAVTNDERRKRRREAKEVGLQLYRAGKHAQAQQELQKAAGVTPQMARQLIDELRKLDVQYIVAPYEADAQLAYLEQKGIINGILSEDSDLLVFGAKRLITKLNQYGECVEIERADFRLCKDINLAGWSDARFRRMAILSGCDYLPSIDKMGLKTAYRFIRKYEDPEKAIRMIAFEGKFCVPPDYVEKFKKAELTFLHHRVFCPMEQKMVYLNELDRDMEESDMPYLGVYVEPEVAVGVACGDLNPKDKQKLDVKPLYPVRPGLKENRRQTLGTPSDLKPKKSIDSFFKSQRTPLAELDPNSLTPSLSQQRLLQQHRNASWEPRPVSSAPQLRRTTSSLSAAPLSASTDRRAFLARASTVSNYQPPKRQRLCSEAEDASSSREVNTSPFFASTAPVMSPLHKKSKRKAKAEFDVWSDDSVEGILMGLVDVHEVATPAKDSEEVEYSQDCSNDADSADDDTVPQSSPIKYPDLSHVPDLSFGNTDSQATTMDLYKTSQEHTYTPVTPDDDPEAFEDLLEYHVRKQNEALMKTFSGQPLSKQQSALKSLQSPKKSGTTSLTSTTTRRQSFSNLARSETPPSFKSDMLKTFAYQSPEQQLSALRSLSPPQTDTKKSELARAALAQQRRERIHGSMSENASTEVLVHDAIDIHHSNVSRPFIRGSEDALVPNSEDEASEGEDGLSRPVMDLRAFAFQP